MPWIRCDAVRSQSPTSAYGARRGSHQSAGRLSEFAPSDLDDLAVQAANVALLVLLRRLDDYRGHSQFWTWARRVRRTGVAGDHSVDASAMSTACWVIRSVH
jgi:hypothetical protein